ncbi:unnamed protein product [Rotaria magnacalcarata]|uniref:VCBS repeat-containing protein n=1 Tax=Rotaria magnacalcarata TaxID=392030 RepID=A0A8S3FG35_9BILA|nr:unnamed protein product [Rotaria magnacalcarata]
MSHGDFNNDTPLDIAVIYQYPKSVDILLGHDNGTFNSIATLLTGTDSFPDYLSISDFNNDDRLNIAITNIGGNNIGIFLGYGNRTFIAQIILRTNEDAPLSAIVTSDFNNDGFKDIGVTILNNSVTIYPRSYKPSNGINLKVTILLVSQPYSYIFLFLFYTTQE